MRRVSNILFWIGVVIDIAFVVILFTLGRMTTNDRDTVKAVIEGIAIIIGLLIVIPVRLASQDERPVLAGVMTILFVGNVAIASGIILFVVNAQENQSIENSPHYISSIHQSYVVADAVRDGRVPRKADTLNFMLKSNQRKYISSTISKEEYVSTKTDIKIKAREHKEVIGNYKEVLNSRLERQIITRDEYNNLIEQARDEEAKLDAILAPEEE